MQDIRQLVRNICENNCEEFLSKENVVGLGYGHKEANGFVGSEPCLKILVSKKLPVQSINPNDMIPENYNGVKTDVVQVGNIKISINSDDKKPMQMGNSIAPAFLQYAGTAGCLVKDCAGYYILSNNHVLAAQNFLRQGAPILAPAEIDGGEYPKDVIAYLTRYVPLEFKVSPATVYNKVDCAIAKVSNTSLVSKCITKIGCVNGVTEAEINQCVKKHGRSSKFTTGIVMAVDVTVGISYEGKIAYFKDQVITTSMSYAGDSGSLLVDYCNNAVGLLVGGSPEITVFNRIKNVLCALNVDIVTCHDCVSQCK